MPKEKNCVHTTEQLKKIPQWQDQGDLGMDRQRVAKIVLEGVVNDTEELEDHSTCNKSKQMDVTTNSTV